MELSQYKREAMRSNVLHGLDYDLDHGVLGVITEIGELTDAEKRERIYGKAIDVVNVKEEVGDIMWYVAVLSTALGFDLKLPETPPHDFEKENLSLKTLCMSLAVSVAMLAGPVVARDIDSVAETFDLKDVAEGCGVVLYLLHCVGKRFSFTLEEAADANIAKLKVRFPDKFTSDLAINRNVEAERAVLEERSAG